MVIVKMSEELYNITVVIYSFFFGLQTPNEAFFHRNPKLLGLVRQFGQINFGPFGIFWANLSASIMVQ